MSSIERSLDDAIAGGAAAAYVHGGVMDNLLATGRLDSVPPAIEKIKAAGIPAGVAGHDPGVFAWAKENLDLDFNSLDAQREAGEAYIKSQQHEGWVCLDDRYEDAGFKPVGSPVGLCRAVMVSCSLLEVIT